MSLIQIALTAEKLFQQQPAIQFAETQCVRTKHAYASCDLCAELCPTDAITLESTLPSINVEHCIKCGICLRTCPVGAFERGDGVYNLLNCAESILVHDTLDITCAHHPSAEYGDRSVDGIIQINNCLSELGPSAVIGLKALGVTHIRVRLDACETCPLRVLQPQIEQAVSDAQCILSAFDLDGSVSIITDADARWRKRSFHQSKNPPVSRRGFFAMLSTRNTSTARAIVPAQRDVLLSDKRTSRERQRLLNALRILSASGTHVNPVATLKTNDFAQFIVQDTCTACGLCERVCPVGALHVEKTDAAFNVYFAPHLCTNCGLCVEYCDPGALEFAGRPFANDVIDDVTISLHTGELQQCERCQTLFASPTTDVLCNVCRYRRNNPSGIGLPDALLAKLPPDTRERLARVRTHAGRKTLNQDAAPSPESTV